MPDVVQQRPAAGGGESPFAKTSSADETRRPSVGARSSYPSAATTYSAQKATTTTSASPSCAFRSSQIQAAACGAVTTKAIDASQPQRRQSRTATVATSAIVMNARLALDVPASTRIGASSAPTRPMPATTWESQRTAIAAAAAPINPASTSPAGAEINP